MWEAIHLVESWGNGVESGVQNGFFSDDRRGPTSCRSEILPIRGRWADGSVPSLRKYLKIGLNRGVAAASLVEYEAIPKA